jgi:phenylpropionate dioxygenase-like ring-hydroxylating dioxygenase large terminal subunit
MLFQGFARVWTPVLPSRRVKKAPVGIRVAGEKVVLFRGEGGTFGALVDRCPHRGVALSLGKVGDDGCLACPFHGWRFGPDGTARHVPLNPDAKLERLSATPLPVREIGDLLWIYTAAETPATEPVPPEALVDPGLRRTYLEVTWNCHWTRAMENMLDTPHLPFVHRTTIGRQLARIMTPTSRLEITWEEMPWGGRQHSRMDGKGELAKLDFHRPNMMALHIPIPGRRFRMHALVIPVDDRTTRLIVASARDFATFPLLDPIFDRVNGFIAAQDQAVVESSDPAEVPPAGDEVSVATDRATLHFRKYYLDELRAGSKPAAPPVAPPT